MTSQLIAVFAQGVMWFASVMCDIELTGGIRQFTLVCRHNSLYQRDVFISNMNNFVFSRIFYTVLALAIIALTIWAYSEKRKGGLNVIRKNIIGKSKT